MVAIYQKHREATLRIICAIFIVLILSPPVYAKPVVTEYMGLDLAANLEIAHKKNLKRHGVVLIVHGTMAHARMELIAELQNQLLENGFNSLAITLSLGLDARKGMYQCDLEHDHRHSDAMAEIAAWVDWLKKQGARNIIVAGHSRGGNQVAQYAARKPDRAVKRIILIAPMTWSIDKSAARYKERYSQDLAKRLRLAEEYIERGDGNMLLPDGGFLNCPNARVTASSFADYYRFNPLLNTPDLLGDIKLPVLVVVGDADEVAVTRAFGQFRKPPSEGIRLRNMRPENRTGRSSGLF